MAKDVLLVDLYANGKRRPFPDLVKWVLNGFETIYLRASTWHLAITIRVFNQVVDDRPRDSLGNLRSYQQRIQCVIEQNVNGLYV